MFQPTTNDPEVEKDDSSASTNNSEADKGLASGAPLSAGDPEAYNNLNDDVLVSADEIIAAMEDFGLSRGTRPTYILRTKPGAFPFQGCCHAEATLATIRYLSTSSRPPVDSTGATSTRGILLD